MTALKNFVEHIRNRLFESIVSKHLVYNTCWEDPRIDRKLLGLDSDSSVVMLTSAGCNALDYLLDDPQTVHAVDANPNQNALLELKTSLFRHGDYDLLFDLFGYGAHPDARHIYRRHLRPHLSRRARQCWDDRIRYFTPSSAEPSFYFRGTSGKVALMMHRHMRQKGIYSKALRLLDATTLDEQQRYYRDIDPRLWSGFHRWLLKRDATMALLGVPAAQRRLIENDFEGGLYRYVKDAMEHVFTRLPIRDNYFWRVYITGSYTRECCPNYLKKNHFERLKNRIDRIRLHTGTLSDFLESNPGSYSHFVLLDHQDWMADAKPAELSREWRLILRNAQPGARILFRSAGSAVPFLPGFVRERVRFDPGRTASLHGDDRVGTYGSTHIGITLS